MIGLWYSFVYGFGSFSLALFTYNLYKSNPKHDSNIYFSAIGLSAFIWIFSEFLYYTFSGNITRLFYIVKYAGICMISYTTLMSSLTTPIRSRIMEVKNIEYYLIIPSLISIILIITFPLNNLFFSGFKEIYVVDGKLRFTGVWGPAFLLYHVPYSYIYLITALLITFKNFVKSRTKIDRVLSGSLIIAILLPFIMNGIVILIPAIYPDPTSLAIIFSSSFLTYVLSKYRIFSLEFKPEEFISGEKINYGKNYLINSSISYSYFRNMASEHPGLVITTRNPDWVRDNFKIEGSPIIWITEVSHEHALRPERLEFEIEYSAIEFFRENKGGIVFLDGIEYIREFQKFDKIHKFLKDVIDISSLYDGTVILNSHDLKLLPYNEKQQIESLFDEIMSGEEVKLKSNIVEIYPDLNDKIDGVYLTSKQPSKIGVEPGKAVWITNSGSGYSQDQLNFEVIEIISRKISEGNNLIIVGIEHIFQGWSIGKFHAYFKLLVDICAKHEKKLIIAPWNNVNEKIRKVVEIYL